METILQTTESANTTQEQIDLDKMSNLVMSDAGTILDGKYEIKREIARGGMGIVYEAYHQYTHQRVAIKVILADRVDTIQLKRFQKEIEAYSLLSHPNVITIHDAGVYKNYPYIVMEYIEGVDICTYVKQQEKNRQEDAKSDESKGRDWKLCARLIYETALGLEYIHSKKMIHRDIKPANILVRPNGSPVIIDLGIVKFNKTQSYNLTRSKETIGTFEYMPIEQAKGKGGKIDARTDVYSLGLVLYELLTGQRAYSGENVMELCYKIMSYYPPMPREIDAQIPKALEEITIHAIEKQREKRYASMKEFADALKQYLDAPIVNQTPQEVLEKGTIPASMIVFEDDLKQYLDTPTAESTPQYGQIQHKLNMKRNKSKVVRYCKVIAYCIVAWLVIELLIGLIEMPILAKRLTSVQFKELPRINNIYNPGIQFLKVKVQDNADEEYNRGETYFKQKDYPKAYECWEKLAMQGHAKAQFMLGNMRAKGQGVRQDYEIAVYWYEKSAIQGHKIAKQALQELKKLMQETNIQDDAESQYNQGLTYYEKEDYVKACEYWEKSANRGYAEAQFKLGLIYEKGDGVEKNHKKAIEWWEKSANRGYAEAQFKLGLIYEKGDGVEKNLEKAVYWFEQLEYNYNYRTSVKYKLDELYNKLGEMYEKGDGVKQDYEIAVNWLVKSARPNNGNGNPEAQYKLGVIFAEGKGGKQNFSSAHYWLRLATEQGHAEAQYYWGTMYEDGKGVRQDLKQAVKLYEKSAKQGNAQAKQALDRLNKTIPKK